MPKPKPSSAPPERLEHYERLVATNPAVERKGATMPYTSLNGHMFSYLDGSGTMALRLPPDRREEFLRKYDAKLMEAHGIVQKEYVAIPADLLARTDELRTYFEASYAYVSGLKPKPTKRSG